jgi:hypothetical protein
MWVKCPRCKGSGKEPVELLDIMSFGLALRHDCQRCDGYCYIYLG